MAAVIVASPANVVSHCANGKLLVINTEPRSYRCAMLSENDPADQDEICGSE